MTALVARPPLQVLSMSAIQSTSRRHSARLQQKEDVQSTNTSHENKNQNATSTTVKAQTSAGNAKKRKNYDEEDDGFVFSRVKKKPRQSTIGQAEPSSRLAVVPEADSITTKKIEDVPEIEKRLVAETQDGVKEQTAKKKRKRMSFSTPGAKEHKPVRRSTQLSTDGQEQGSPVTENAKDLRPARVRKDKAEKHRPPAQHQEAIVPVQPEQDAAPAPTPPDESHSSTKIALPFADTPVISRNKAMREGKSGKADRRSSLGLRGRRASSLIDSGTSNGMYTSCLSRKMVLTAYSSASLGSGTPRLLQAY